MYSAYDIGAEVLGLALGEVVGDATQHMGPFTLDNGDVIQNTSHVMFQHGDDTSKFGGDFIVASIVTSTEGTTIVSIQPVVATSSGVGSPVPVHSWEVAYLSGPGKAAPGRPPVVFTLGSPQLSLNPSSATSSTTSSTTTYTPPPPMATPSLNIPQLAPPTMSQPGTPSSSNTSSAGGSNTKAAAGIFSALFDGGADIANAFASKSSSASAPAAPAPISSSFSAASKTLADRAARKAQKQAAQQAAQQAHQIKPKSHKTAIIVTVIVAGVLALGATIWAVKRG